MTPRELSILFLIGIAGMILVIGDHRQQADTVLSAVKSAIPEVANLPSERSAFAWLDLTRAFNIFGMFGTTNDAIPNAAAGASGGLKLAMPAYPSQGKQFSSIWESAEL